MAAETLKDFLIGIGYEVDEAGAQKADQAVNSLDQAVRALGEILIQAADKLKSFISDAAKGSDEIAEGAESMEAAADAAASLSDGEAQAADAAREMADAQAGVGDAVAQQTDAMQQGADATVVLGEGEREAADAAGELGDAAGQAAKKTEDLGKSAQNAAKHAKSAAEGFKQANNAAKMQNAKTGSVNLKQMNNELKRGISLIKRFVGAAAAFVIGGSIKSAISDVLNMNEGLAESAKKLKKSIEETRAYNTALALMGKTAEEIKNSKALTATFNGLQAIGAQMALPQAAQGVHAIQDMKDALLQLKFTGTYVMQWLVYRIQTVAEGPLAEIRTMIGDLKDKLVANVDKVASALAKGVSWAVQILGSVVKAISTILGWIDKLPPAIKVVGAVALAVIAAIHSKAFLITMIVGAILLLIDDLMTYLSGGQALFADFWAWGVEAFTKINDAITEAIESIKKFYNESTDESGKTNWILFGLKIGKWILDGAKTILKASGNLIKKWIVGNENATWPEVAQAILNGIKEKASVITNDIKAAVTGDPNASWPEVADAIINGIIFKAGEILNQVKKAITGGENASLPDVATAIIKGITEKAGDILSEIKKAIAGDENATIFDVAEAIIRGIIARTGNILTAVKGAITGNVENPTWTDVAAAIKKGIDEQASIILNAVKKAILGDPNASWTEVGQKIAAGINEFASSILAEVKKAITGTSDASWSDVGSTLWGYISGAIKAAATSASEFWKGVFLDGLDRGGIVGSLEKLLASAALLALSVKTSVVTAIDKLKENGTLGDIWNALKSITQSVLEIVEQIISAITGSNGGDGFKAFGETLANVVQGAVEVISAALRGLDTVLKWVALIFTKANEAEALGAALTGIGVAIATYFAVSKLMAIVSAVVTLFQAFASGTLIMTSLNPVLLAIAASIGAIVAVIEWLQTRTERIDKTVGDYIDKTLDWVDTLMWEIEGTTNSVEDAMNALEQYLSQLVESGEITAEEMQAIKQAYKEYMNPDGTIDWEKWENSGRKAIQSTIDGMREEASSAKVEAPEMEDAEIDVKVTDAESAKAALQSAQEAANALSSSSDSASSAVSGTTTTVEALNEQLEALQQEAESIGEDFTVAGETIGESLQGASTTSEEALTSIKEVSEETAAAVLDALSKLDEPVSGVFASIKTLATGAMQHIKSEVSTGFETAKSKIVEKLTEIKVYIAQDQTFESLVEKSQSATASVVEDFSAMSVETSTSMGLMVQAGITMDKAFATICTNLGLNVTKAKNTIVSAFNAVVTGAKRMASGITSAIRGLPSSVASTFNSLASSIQSAMSRAASSVSSAVSGIKSSLNSIPKSVNVNVNTTKTTTEKKYGRGGVEYTEQQVTVGDTGKEYMIPVEGPDPKRAKALLRAAAADLGLTVESHEEASRMLGGSALRNVTPNYVNNNSSTSQSVTNNNQVMAPATINVYGNDPQSTARNVAKNQEKLLVRNLRSILA